MPARNMDKIFKPENIAVVGESEQDSAGYTFTENLMDRCEGEVFPVFPGDEEVLGKESFSDVGEIPNSVDLGIIAVQPSSVPEVVKECGEADISALVIASKFGKSESVKEIEDIREQYDMRILGPGSLGVKNPSANLNASLTKHMPSRGEVTFLFQGDALASATLDWAMSAQFGFSSFVSLGEMIDVDFADLIDYFGRDPSTRSILMYIEDIKNPEKFMSAARSFARTKPIMAVRSGKHIRSEENFSTLVGSLANTDRIYNAAFKRAGVTRVDTIEDLFTCSETLAKQALPEGPNLAIVANARDTARMTMDILIDQGGNLSSLEENTVEKLEDVLPEYESVDNPLTIAGDSGPSEYRESIEICLDDENVDGVLCIYTPFGDLDSTETAEAIANLKERTEKPILTCWMGGEGVQEGRSILRQHGYPVQSAPEQSIRAYMYLNRYARNLERLLETPEELPVERTPPKYNLKAMLRRVARDGRTALTEQESKKIIETYGISTPQYHLAASLQEAKGYAAKIGFPVVMKINTSKVSEREGEQELKANSETEVEEIYEELTEIMEDDEYSAKADGIIVQEDIDKDIELLMGSKMDPNFQASLIFGKGGEDAECYADIEIDFPPLNQTLARRMMEDTEIYNKLKKLRSESNDVLRKLEENLVRLSQLIIDFPVIEELEINPMAKIGEEFVAMNPKIIINKDNALDWPEDHKHLVIEPYPRKYIEEWELDDGRPVTLRPIRPEDEPLEFELFDTFSKETWRNRFFGPMKKVSHEDMVRFTNIDYRREMAIIGILEEEGERKMIGVGRLIVDPSGDSGEFAVVVGDPWQGLGLGEKLLDAVIGVAEDKGLKYIWGSIMKGNTAMLNLCKKLGFDIEEEDERTLRATLNLR